MKTKIKEGGTMIDPNVRIDRIVNLDWLLSPTFRLQWRDLALLEDNIEWLANKMGLDPEGISECEDGYPFELAYAIQNKKLREKMGLEDDDSIWLVFVSAPEPAQKQAAQITGNGEVLYTYHNGITNHEILLLSRVDGDLIMKAAQEWRRQYLESKGLI